MVHNARLPLNLELSIDVDPENINLVNKLVEIWRSFSSGAHNEGGKQRSLKLSISIGDDANAEEKVRECHTALETIISNNRDIMTTSLSIKKLPSIEASDAYSGLANCCDSVTIDDESVGKNKNVKLINSLVSAKTLNLTVDSLDSSFAETIPDTLQTIELKVGSYDIPSIKLPLSLRKLRLDAREVPEILNVEELTNLTEATICCL
ncbi:unnamed protein product [Ambrosiozyma monospora]|uniref:Unnamed protein product n=1 Tax=Ambrosiozyma monospora TaxID=43982 RepID=A0ACB5T250_AMBMO|nr:unnamed protein product [Ambrosiozyma monospora]